MILISWQCVSPLNRHDYGTHSSNPANSNTGCSSLPVDSLALCSFCCSRATLGLTMVSLLTVVVLSRFRRVWVHASISNTKRHYCRSRLSVKVLTSISHMVMWWMDISFSPRMGIKLHAPRMGCSNRQVQTPTILTIVQGRTLSGRVNFSRTKTML